MKRINLLTVFTFLTMAPIPFTACTTNEAVVELSDQNDIYKMLHYASLAGSSHNSQPWKAEVYPNDSIVVVGDTSRMLDVVDPTGRELFISVGAFIENFDIAARSLGYRAEITVIETGIDSSYPAASIQLVKMEQSQNASALRDMELRTTLRIPFDKQAIKAEDQEKLISIAPENIRFIPSDSPDGLFIAEKELEAYTIQAYDKLAQDELATWMRFSSKDIITKRDGLTPAGMGITGLGGFIVTNFMKPDDSKKESFVKKGVEKTKLQVEHCGGWILITTDNDRVTEWINAGRMYERMNIECRSLELGFHPMNQLVEVPEIEQEVNEKLTPGRKILFVARVGYVKESTPPVSKRRTVESFTTFR